MKKIFALLLVVLMLVPFVASCRQPDNNDTDTSTTPPTDTSTDTDTDSDVGPVKPSDKKDVAEAMEKYRGETVNIMAAVWSNGEAGAPWSQVELCVTDYMQDAKGYGTIINDGVMERQEAIEQAYGVKLNWISCQGPSMLDKLSNAAMNKGQAGVEEIIHVAMPHVYEAMQIVIEDAVYAMGSDYINFDAEYFNQESVEQYTLAGNTFFAGGDISFLDEQTAYVLFYNNTVAADFGSAFPDLYKATVDGTWTIDKLYDLSGSIKASLDGKDEQTDADKYGLGSSQIDCYFQYFGVYQVGKSKDVQGNEVFALTIENDNVKTIIEKMLYAKKNGDSIRTSWSGGWEAMGQAFGENRLLFYHEVLQKIFTFDSDLKVGILPFPKLTTSQSRYYVPSAGQATIVCIPRATDDKVLSECMVEILSKTGGEYIMPAYVESIEEKIYVDEDAEEGAVTALDVIVDSVFPNLMFDLGYMYGRYNGDGQGLITTSVQEGCIEGGNNNFTMALEQARVDAEKMLSDWSYAYNAYEE